jgi:hypothetical protein
MMAVFERRLLASSVASPHGSASATAGVRPFELMTVFVEPSGGERSPAAVCV